MPWLISTVSARRRPPKHVGGRDLDGESQSTGDTVLRIHSAVYESRTGRWQARRRNIQIAEDGPIVFLLSDQFTYNVNRCESGEEKIEHGVSSLFGYRIEAVYG